MLNLLTICNNNIVDPNKWVRLPKTRTKKNKLALAFVLFNWVKAYVKLKTCTQLN